MLENAKKRCDFQSLFGFKSRCTERICNNPYKTELIENLQDGEITFCTHDNFTDLLEVVTFQVQES